MFSSCGGGMMKRRDIFSSAPVTSRRNVYRAANVNSTNVNSESEKLMFPDVVSDIFPAVFFFQFNAPNSQHVTHFLSATLNI